MNRQLTANNNTSLLCVSQEVGGIALTKFKLRDLDRDSKSWDGLQQVGLELYRLQLISNSGNGKQKGGDGLSEWAKTAAGEDRKERSEERADAKEVTSRGVQNEKWVQRTTHTARGGGAVLLPFANISCALSVFLWCHGGWML